MKKFNDLSIFAKLMGMGALIGAAILILIILKSVQDNEVEQVSISRQIDINMLQARRSEKDFLARKDLEYLDKVLEKTNDLIALCGEVENKELSDKMKLSVVEYQNAFKLVVEATQKRGLSEKEGAEGALREAVHGIEEIIDNANLIRLKADMLSIRRSEKDYFLRGAEKYITAVAEKVETLKSSISTSRLNADQKNNALLLADTYQIKFDEAVAAIQNQNNQKEKMREAIHKIEPLIIELEAEATAHAETISSTVLVVQITLILVLLVITYLLAKIISKPIIELSLAAEKFAAGERVYVESNSIDEVGRLGAAFNNAVEAVFESREELEKEKASVELKVEEAVKESEEQKTYLSESVHKILEEMNKFSEGNLTVSLTAKSNDDIGNLYSGFNNAVEKIRNMVIEVTEAVQATASASSEISASAEQMAAGAQEQSVQTNDVAAAVEEMTRTVVETSQNAVNAASSAEEANSMASEGMAKVNENKEGIQKISTATEKTGKVVASLSKKSDQIGEIAQVIDDIADQTNLLALNAAIEAARAGEQGRGFAVVADEVRKLAERTTKATKEIAETIKAIQTEAMEADKSMSDAKLAVTEGLEISEAVSDVLSRIVERIGNVTAEINQVATASEEQSATAEQIGNNIESIRNVANESAEAIQQVAATTDDLNKLTVRLTDLVNEFVIAKEEHKLLS